MKADILAVMLVIASLSAPFVILASATESAPFVLIEQDLMRMLQS